MYPFLSCIVDRVSSFARLDRVDGEFCNFLYKRFATESNLVVVAVANRWYIDQALDFMQHSNLPVIIGCVDEYSCARKPDTTLNMPEMQIPLREIDIIRRDARCYSWRLIQLYKTWLLEKVVTCKLHVLILDVDHLPSNNSLEVFRSSTADIIVKRDHTKSDYGSVKKFLNFGAVYLRSSTAVQSLVRLVLELSYSTWDQAAFNYALQAYEHANAVTCMEMHTLQEMGIAKNPRHQSYESMRASAGYYKSQVRESRCGLPRVWKLVQRGAPCSKA